MRIGLIAPPWIPVPPTAYGGTELVVDHLARGLAARGHDVRLVTVGESTCPVEQICCFDRSPSTIGEVLPETVHVLHAYELLGDVDLIHDHTTLGPVLSLGRVDPEIPVVVTHHGPITPLTKPLLRAASRHTTLVAISHAQRRDACDVPIDAVVHHGIDLDRLTPGPGDGGYLLFLGRMSPDKGAHRAIRIARALGRPLVMISKMWEDSEHAYFSSTVRPMLGSDVELLLATGPEDRVRLLRGAEALVNPISWAEPFGLAMAEALACGTPVLAAPRGAAPEIVDHGITGFLADSEEGLIEAARQLDQIDRARCREAAVRRFSIQRMVRNYERLYIRLLAGEDGLSLARIGRAVKEDGARERSGGPTAATALLPPGL
jgi:glycosyltransferase involved in cell wall biosynthesis